MSRKIWSGILVGALLGVTTAYGDVTGSYDGTLLPKKSTESLAAAAVFSQAGKLLSGTVALPADLVSFGGAYLVSGKATPKKVKVSGIGVPGKPWSVELNAAIVRDTIEAFGVERSMFASNFPVDSLTGDFDTIYSGFKTIVADLPEADQRKLFHDNAVRIYRI